MKCIKEKCKLYLENDWRESCFNCSLDSVTYYKTSNIKCKIEKMVNMLLEQMEFIKNNQ